MAGKPQIQISAAHLEPICRSGAIWHFTHGCVASEAKTYRSLLHTRQTDVDILSATGLVTVDRQGVLARLERGLGGRKHLDDIVFGSESLRPSGEDTVEIDLRILIVMDPELERRKIHVCGDCDLAADIDVRRVPSG